jgi:hypothetical protein
MKTEADVYPDTPVLEAAIADETFSSFAASLQQAGIRAVRHHRHIRQVQIALAQLTCVVGLATLFWFTRSEPQQLAHVAPVIAPATHGAASAHYISEAQMLAMFPNGSCALAEVNGRKELVFLELSSTRRVEKY